MIPSPVSGKLRTVADKSRRRILIVDDEPLVCWALATGLRVAGFDAITVSTAAEALALARAEPPPDAALLDSRLNDQDPAALLRDLGAAAPACRFLVLTTEEDAVPPLRAGAIVIRKPFDLTDVVSLVNRALMADP